MSLLGMLLGRPGTAAPPAPPAPPAPTVGSTPVVAPDAGSGAGAATNHDFGSSSGTRPGTPPAAATPSSDPPSAARPAPAFGGTPVTAPATRHAFTSPEGPGASEDRERAYALANQRKWRMVDVVAAISGGPRAQLLIEAASRPGPVQPGSLLEAIKALRPAPTLPESTRTV